MITLIEFQAEAANRIVNRYVSYQNSPVITGTKSKVREVPFFQFLSSLTASGKTVIMADAVAGISAASPVDPVVLWLSRGKVVVKQTYAGLLPGGRYNHLLGDAEVRALADYDADELATVAKPFVFVATVGTFTREDREKSDLAIHKSDLDDQDASTWEQLKLRLGPGDVRRPLVVVYDEAHNLSDLQTELLLEQEPSGLVLASATMRLPARMEAEVAHLRQNGWKDEDLVTHVDARRVAESGLVKSILLMAGYKTPMEEAVAQLLDDKAEADAEAVALGAPGPTKAIYVCNTNIVEGDSRQRDNHRRPFNQREAPPILIWRYLVEQRGINPDRVAVYCNLSFDKGHPPPAAFHIFSGQNDYTNFISGEYEHVIFNLTLQEGWDDPLCYFAYVDKSMESRVQIEQIVGRVLRQPGLTRYPSAHLNTAHFYVRVDRTEVFGDVLDSVEGRLRRDAPAITFLASKTPSDKPVEWPARKDLKVPTTALITQHAAGPIATIMDSINDYRADSGANVESSGARTVVRRKVGADESGQAVWEEYETSSFVLARWIFSREVRSRYGRALEVAITADAKFDAKVGLGSKAETQIVKAAEQVVDTYLDEVIVSQKPADPYVVGPIMVRPANATMFANAVHDGYDGLNGFELEFAHAVDRSGRDWARNPSRVGYGIPLVTIGATSNFYPDFLVWEGNTVFLVDTKGEHLIRDAVAAKLLNIRKPKSTEVELSVRFVSKGKWRKDVVRESADGYTVWGLNATGGIKVSHASDLDAIVWAILQ